MAHAVHAVQQKVNEGSIILEDVTDIVIEQELYTQVKHLLKLSVTCSPWLSCVFQ